jgi:hypothetical protein
VKISSLFSGPLGVVILLAFFMPWITISCDNGFGGEEELMTTSGLDLATGVKVQDTDLGDWVGDSYTDPSYGADSPDDTVVDAAPYLWLLPVLGLGIGFVALLRFLRSISGPQAGMAYFAAGLLGLVLHIIKYLGIRSDFSDANTDGVLFVHYNYGWWLSIIAFLALLVVALVAWNEQDRPAYYPYYQQPPYYPPGGYYPPQEGNYAPPPQPYYGPPPDQPQPPQNPNA